MDYFIRLFFGVLSKQTHLIILFHLSFFNLLIEKRRKVIYKFFRRTPDIGTAAVFLDVGGPDKPANAGEGVPTNDNALNVFGGHFM